MKLNRRRLFAMSPKSSYLYSPDLDLNPQSADYMTERQPLPERGIRMKVASSRPDHLPTLTIAETSEHSLLDKSLFEAERSMPALLLLLLLQCAGDIEMNPGSVSIPTSTNILRLMQKNAN